MSSTCLGKPLVERHNSRAQRPVQERGNGKKQLVGHIANLKSDNETKQLHIVKLGTNGALSPGGDARVLDWAVLISRFLDPFLHLCDL